MSVPEMTQYLLAMTKAKSSQDFPAKKMRIQEIVFRKHDFTTSFYWRTKQNIFNEPLIPTLAFYPPQDTLVPEIRYRYRFQYCSLESAICPIPKYCLLYSKYAVSQGVANIF